MTDVMTVAYGNHHRDTKTQRKAARLFLCGLPLCLCVSVVIAHAVQAQPRFYLKPLPRSNRIRHMPRSRDSWVFALTLMTAAAVLVSIAAAETLLAMACLAAIVRRPRPVVWPSYLIPLGAFMAATVVALLMSPQPDIGMG